MAAKLKIVPGERWGDFQIQKKKGKITFDELMRFMHEREQIFQHDGKMCIVAFRISGERDMYSYMDEWNGQSEGDALDIILVEDDMVCTICGNSRLYLQYCPDCGRELTVKEKPTGGCNADGQ